jgi:hypothetical protein
MPGGHVGNARREARRHSELDLLRQRQGVIDFDPEIADSALDLCMSEQQLDRSRITSRATYCRGQD